MQINLIFSRNLHGMSNVCIHQLLLISSNDKLNSSSVCYDLLFWEMKRVNFVLSFECSIYFSFIWLNFCYVVWKRIRDLNTTSKSLPLFFKNLRAYRKSCAGNNYHNSIYKARNRNPLLFEIQIWKKSSPITLGSWL